MITRTELMKKNIPAYDLVERYHDHVHLALCSLELDNLRLIRDATKDKSLDEKTKQISNWDIKHILIGSIHYNLDYKGVVRTLVGHRLLIPTLLEMIRERPHYRRVMARILVIFIYLEDWGYTTLYESIKEDIEKYDNIPLKNRRGFIFINALQTTHTNHGNAMDTLNCYRLNLLKECDPDGASMVEDESKGVW